MVIWITFTFYIITGSCQGKVRGWESLVEPAMAAEAANRHLLLWNVAYLLQVRICTLMASDVTARLTDWMGTLMGTLIL